jgi:Na+-transporting NADH:ubiquinone oxidoreductase subunit A
MATIKLKKGFCLKLKGKITDSAEIPASASTSFAIIPDDFTGIVPRLDKKEGDTVMAGEAVYHDKNNEAIKVTSPVSGTLKEVRRGDRRKIEAIVIEPDGNDSSCTIDISADAKDALLQSGLWVMLRQRPYDIVPNPEVRPRDIFVTCFDSSPLAPEFKVVLGDSEKFIEKGVSVLSKFTDGKIYLGCEPDNVINVEGAETNVFVGPHPAGNAGVQIANVKPVNKGEVVWTLDVVTLARIGELFTTGKVNYNTTVAVDGSQVIKPQYVKATIGCTIESIVKDNLVDFDNRIISGNVLTGTRVEADGYLRAPYRHVTVIPEVENKDEFMGWLSLSPKKFSIYRDFTGWLFGRTHKENKLDSRINGSERAIVMCGEYDRMLPMDIYAEFLIKAIITFDIDKMEELGIYEVAPEDFALAEYADTSKLELQRIVREGLDKMRKEMA